MKSREEMDSKFCWDLTALYEDEKAFEKELSIQLKLAEETPPWTELSKYQEKIQNSAQELTNFLSHYFQVLQILDKIFTYAHLKHDENITHPEHKKYFDQAHHLMHLFQSHFSWVEPVLLKLDMNLIQDASLEPYRHHLDTILRLKPYTLSMEQERLMGLTGKWPILLPVFFPC